MGDTIITLEDLTKNYGKLKAVDNLNLQIRKGEIFGLLGPNGAGKTTTILMMLGLSEPTSGIATVCGFNATTTPISVKKKVGYMPDNIGFYDHMTALENLMYIGSLNSIPVEELEDRAYQVMETVGLSNVMHKKTATYSRGMKQRLGLADVLIKQPEVIILDEPTLGIDPSGIKEFLKLIQSLSIQQGLTVILSSHHLHQVQQVCDRVGIFVEGKLLAEGNIDQLSKELFLNTLFTIQISLKTAITQPWDKEQELLQVESVQKISINENSIQISTKEDITPDVVRFFVEKGYDITGVSKMEYGLEDIYQKFITQN